MSKSNSTELPKPEQTPTDPFDPASLRLSQNFEELANAEGLLTKVPCRKPNKQEFFRVRPGEEWRVDTALFEEKSEREWYLVDSEFQGELIEDLTRVCLRVWVNVKGNLFLWPLPLPNTDGDWNEWHRSASDQARRAEKAWIRIRADQAISGYSATKSRDKLDEPNWRKESLRDLLEIAFRDRHIDANDHPVLKKMRGQI